MMNEQGQKRRNAHIAQDSLSGMGQIAIGKKHGIGHQHVSTILRKDEIRDIIEQGTVDMISLVPDAVDVHKSCLKMIKGKDKDPKVAQSSATTVLKTTGIIPSHTAISIDKLLIDNRSEGNLEIQGLQEFMAFKYRDVGADKVIDVTPEEDKEADE